MKKSNLTIGELKKIIETLPDDMLIYVPCALARVEQVDIPATRHQVVYRFVGGLKKRVLSLW